MSTSSSSSSSSSTSPVRRPSTSNVKSNYYQSPINSDESDVDLSDNDPTYAVDRSITHLTKAPTLTASNSSLSSDNDQLNTSSVDNNTLPESARKSRKRTRDPTKWKQNVAKNLRNSGKAYLSCTTKKNVPARSIKEPCKCRLKCSENINDTDRQTLFERYWAIGNINLQRSYIRSCMMEIRPKYKYTNAAKPRLPNNAFYFTVNSNKIRVCKTFFINTLGICDRQIRTIKKKTDPQNFVSEDNRGKHVSRKPIDVNLIESIKGHINSIPRIESHYLRASTSREYISGEKTIMDLWKDFDKLQKEEGKPSCDYWLYYNIFNKEFNIGFFQPKKDRCDLCVDYEMANPARKIDIQAKYDDHLKEKDLCRQEKRLDRQNIDETNICAVYDLQAVMQCPTGESSSFFYKSKLNCLNFTIVEMTKKSEEVKKGKKTDKENVDEIRAYDNVYCYFWDEVQGKRGANEIGSSILDYLHLLNEQNPNKTLHITFFSDNCCGQNKNKYITTLYSYAVSKFENIHSITHKYLVKGHTQNEGDNVHSLIEKEIKRNKKSGPLYTPYQYITLIKNSRKTGKPFNVKELTYDFFKDLKILQEKWGYNFNEDVDKQNISWNNVRVLKFCKTEPFVFLYKTSYTQNEFISVNMRNKRKKMEGVDAIMVTKAYSQRLELSDRKKSDLRDLINKNLIPSYYADFYNSIF